MCPNTHTNMYQRLKRCVPTNYFLCVPTPTPNNYNLYSDDVEQLNAKGHHVIVSSTQQSNEYEYFWYQCTIKGGRESRDLDVVELVKACEELGVGEILLNCINRDGTNRGFDLDLIRLVKSNTSLPVIVSSGAGNVGHFTKVFQETKVDAALAAGIFHRGEVSIPVRAT